MSKRAIAKRNKKSNKNIAKEHMEELFILAQNHLNSPLAHNSISLAVKYSTRYKIPIRKEIKRTYCKKCFNQYTAENSTKRINKGIITITCSCKTQKRIKIKE